MVGGEEIVCYTQLIETPDDGMHDQPKYILSKSIVYFVTLNLVNPRF
jgi:hypothetical protein